MSPRQPTTQPQLVFLHGFLGSAGDWQPLLQLLPATWQCHCLDLPGHGSRAAQPLPPEQGFARFSQWLDHWLATHINGAYVLIGYSLGGRLAMYHACRGRWRPTALFIESAHPGLTDENARRQRIQHDDRWAARFRTEPIERVLGDWYQQPVFASLTAVERLALIKLRSTNQGPALADMLQATSLGRQPSLGSSLASCGHAVHYCCGEADTKFNALGRQLALDNPTISCQTVPGAGHNCHREHPVVVARQLQRLVAQACEHYGSND